MKKFFKFSLTGLAFIFIANCVYLYQAQDNIIFQYRPLDQEYVFQQSASFKERFYPIAPNVSLHALYFPTNFSKNSKGVVLCFHGRGTNLSRDWGKTAINFTEKGYDFIVYDYRGFGKSNGKLDKKNIYEDPLKLTEIIAAEYPNKELILYGRSLGTAFATYVAAQHNPTALILESPFYSMLDMACLTKPYIPRFLVETILKYPLRTHQLITKVQAPILIVHGAQDDIVPFCEAIRLFDTIKHKPENRFVKIDDRGHSNLLSTQEYKENLETFLKLRLN